MEVALSNKDRQLQGQTQSKEEYGNSMTLYEKQMLEVKYKSPPFAKMNEEMLKVAASKLILKINLITGWAMYEDNASQEMFKEEFEFKLKESYPTVNLDEMIFAFRNNTTVKDWGKSMNLALIDEVMIPYLDKRFEVSRVEEQKKNKQQLPPPKEDDPMTDDEFIEMNYRTWNVLKNPGIISTKCYGILVAQKKINLSQEEKDKMFEQVDWFLRLKMNSDRNWHEELNPIYQSANKDHWKARVFNECKKRCVEFYFKTL